MSTSPRLRRPVLIAGLGLALLVPAACGGEGAAQGQGATATVGASTAGGVRTLGAQEAAGFLGGGRVVLDIRTPEEFAEGHLAGAQLLDFYRTSFAQDLAELDRDTPYLLYCRSGNRSGQARQLMQGLGFTDVVEVGGGILAWDAAGLPVEG